MRIFLPLRGRLAGVLSAVKRSTAVLTLGLLSITLAANSLSKSSFRDWTQQESTVTSHSNNTKAFDAPQSSFHMLTCKAGNNCSLILQSREGQGRVLEHFQTWNNWFYYASSLDQQGLKNYHTIPRHLCHDTGDWLAALLIGATLLKDGLSCRIQPVKRPMVSRPDREKNGVSCQVSCEVNSSHFFFNLQMLQRQYGYIKLVWSCRMVTCIM